MASARDREVWAHIFKLYKSFPHLWDKNNIHYGNRQMMTNGYKILTRVYREKLDKSASVGTLRMKMKNLRTTYYRELRKIKEANKKGERYTPSLWYFENLNFLRNPQSRESTADASQDDNIQSPQMHEIIHVEDSVQVDDLELDDSDIEFDPGPSTSQQKTTRRTETLEISSPINERQEHFTDCAENTMKDEHWEVIGKSIGYQLKDLNKKQYTIVSKLISDAIYYGRLNRLSEVSHIELGPPYSCSNPQSPRYSTYSPSVHYRIHAVDVPTDQSQNIVIKGEVEN